MTAAANVHTLTVRREVPASPTELFDAWLDAGSWRPGCAPGFATFEGQARSADRRRVQGRHANKQGRGAAYRYLQGDRPPEPARIHVELARGGQSRLAGDDRLQAVGRATEVILKHENLPSDEEVEGHLKGWTRILELMSQAYAQAA